MVVRVITNGGRDWHHHGGDATDEQKVSYCAGNKKGCFHRITSNRRPSRSAFFIRILNLFEICDLKFIWNLFFGIWNFLLFVVQSHLNMTFTPDQITIGILAVAVLILGISVFYQDWRLNKLLKGKNAKNLEDSFGAIEKEYKQMKNFRDAMSSYLTTVEERLGISIQGVETVRFNAWKGAGEGGNQSFASAFLSEKGDGVIISSLYSRDRVSVFAKPIKDFKSGKELTIEEKEALQKAQGQIKITSSK